MAIALYHCLPSSSLLIDKLNILYGRCKITVNARLSQATVSQPCYGDVFGVVCLKKIVSLSVPPNSAVDNSQERKC